MTVVATLLVVVAIGGCSSGDTTVAADVSPTSGAAVATSGAGATTIASHASVPEQEHEVGDGSPLLTGRWKAVSPLKQFLCVGAAIGDADSTATTLAPAPPYPCSVDWRTVNDLEISDDGAVTIVIDPLDDTSDGSDSAETSCSGTVDTSISQVTFADDSCTSQAGPVTNELGTIDYEVAADCLVVRSGDDETEVDRHYARGNASCESDAEAAEKFEAVGNAVASSN